MNDKEILDDLIAAIKARLPKFDVRYKDESLFQRFLGFIMFFNRAYMTQYTTTMFGKVYFTSRAWVGANPKQAWKILAHEYVHLLDGKDHPILFPVTYALPQLSALGALAAFGAFWTPWALLALLFLVALAPWRSKGRTKAEMRGYAMSMAVAYWTLGSISRALKEHVGARFWGPNYYYMCRNKSYVISEIDIAELKILKGDADRVTHPMAVTDVLQVLHARGALRAGVRVGAEGAVA
jgi:hypothetical protein